MRKPPRRALLTALVYGGVLLLLLLLAFFTRGFSQALGDARIGGRYALIPLFQSKVLNTLTVTWNGMSLHFSRSTTPALQGIETGDAGTDILFAGDARLHLGADADTAGSLSLSATAPSAAASGPVLLIPFTISGASVPPGPDAALAWKRAGQLYLLSLPAGAKADEATRLLTLPLGPGAVTATLKVAGAAIAAAPARTASVRAVARPRTVKLPDEQSMPTEGQLREAISRFVDAAYLGWTQDRYSPATGQWKLADGSSGFSADIGAPLLAEAVTRGAWQRVLPLWSAAEALQGRRAGEAPDRGAASAYLGGARDYVRSLAARQAADIERVRGLLAKPDPSLLAIADLVLLLLVNGSPENVQAAVAYMVSVNPSGLDVAASLALLQDLLDYGESAGASESVTRALRALITTRVLPSVGSAEAGVFLLTDSAGHADLLAGVRCGALLLRAGTLLKDTLAAAVGRGLMTSALGLADAAGNLPAAITISSGRVNAREGTIAPESLYTLLPIERRWPRQKAAANAFGPGAWVWTAARIVSAEGSTEDARIVFSYPAGIPYHLAIVGVKSFRLLRLHGIAWHADPEYAKYSDGWSYEPSTRTLYMKITGKAEQEEISIHY
jgi:hypothetical protein